MTLLQNPIPLTEAFLMTAKRIWNRLLICDSSKASSYISGGIRNFSSKASVVVIAPEPLTA